MKHVLVTGGGTAGHVLPAIPVIEECLKAGWKVSFIGSRSGLEETLLSGIELNYFSIPTGKFRRYFTLKNVLDFFSFFLGIINSLMIVIRIKPDVIFSKGGFVSLPVVVAGWVLRVPILAHESDSSPGLANRISLRFLKTYCTTFPTLGALDKRLKYKIVNTGSPIRHEILSGHADRGRALLDFGNTKPLLLVTGGSLGAKFLNDKIRQGLDPLTEDFNVLHVCGRGNLAPINKSGYIQKEYVSDNWGDFLAAADLVVSRAGANAMLELLSLKKVCVFVPLSRRVSRGDQIENARFVSDNNFGCVLQEEELTVDLFLNGITRTFSNRETHQRALAEFRPKDSSALIYKEIVELG